MEQEALKRSPGWQLYHKWTFRLELAQQVRRQLRDTLGGCNGVSVLGDIPKAYGSKRQEKTLRTETSQLWTQVAAAVSYMHANDVIHLDLTSQNLLVADGGNAKVSTDWIRDPL